MTDHDLSRRKILGGIVTIGAAGAAAGAGTMAYFSDTESSTGNTIQAGTMDLTGGISSTSISTTSLAPGESVSQSFSVTNSGSVAGDHVEFDVTFVENDNSTPGEYQTDVPTLNTALSLGVSDLTYDTTNYSTDWSALPGSFIEEVSSVPNGSGDAPIHITSHSDETIDYNYVEADVSSQAVTVGTLTGGTFEYEWQEGGINTANTPDEVFIVLENGTTLFRNESTSYSGSDWDVRDLGSELNDSGWIDLSDRSSANPSNYSNKTVSAVAIGVGDAYNSDTGNQAVARVFDVYVDQLNVDGTMYSFRPNASHTFTYPQPNLQDLQGSGSLITLDELANPGTSGGGKSMSIEFTLDSDAGNPYQGDGVDIDLDFALAQQSGQNVLPK